jgi:hypothetical protein
MRVGLREDLDCQVHLTVFRRNRSLWLIACEHLPHFSTKYDSVSSIFASTGPAVDLIKSRVFCLFSARFSSVMAFIVVVTCCGTSLQPPIAISPPVRCPRIRPVPPENILSQKRQVHFPAPAPVSRTYFHCGPFSRMAALFRSPL